MGPQCAILCLCILGVLFLQTPVKACESWDNCNIRNLAECRHCKSGFCGKCCDKSCFGNCSFDCYITTCECRACADGFHGSKCSRPCPEGCGAASSKIATCKRISGACTDGCKKERCSPETGCDKVCSKNCINKTCMFEDCSCDHGCIDGYWGTFCEKPCKKPCENCSQCDQNKGTCLKPDTHVPGDLQCSNCTLGRCERRVVCSEGCQPGLYGEECGKTCLANCKTCNQFTGLCESAGQDETSGCRSLSPKSAAAITLFLGLLLGISSSHVLNHRSTLLCWLRRTDSANVEEKKRRIIVLISIILIIIIIIILFDLFVVCFI